MQVITDASPRYTNTAIALGNFDGVHIGHQEIIKNCILNAKFLQLTPCVMTFDPHPKTVLQPHIANQSINSLEDKLSIFESLGVKVVFVIPFSQKIASTSAHTFIEDILIDKLNAKYVTTGYNFYFGQNREGCYKMLGQYSDNFRYHVINRISCNHHHVSTSNIKHMLQLGACSITSKILGRFYSVSGIVIKGKQNARTIGFSTANIAIQNTPLLYGVYLVRVLLEGELYWGIANIGVKPTVNHDSPLLEVHIFDFKCDIYGKSIKVEFINFIRPERKFASLDVLKSQIIIDVDNATHVIKLKYLNLAQSL